ncbi:dihydrofolate reductase family protein [Seonamhaeicola marinus]|uniref:Dihydrofolate reductase n=1 Tax=Seonamhaeicola marinus TaxID=1912246 RepID=A0A5D0HJD0_9FLAO|nr:dihydrofolate reductase family protein [Seonamhaeicola marinus]TYA71398.1 dihydrofolate reductase [Seonamhaeicola marinus]
MRKLAILTFQSLDGIMQAPSDPKEDTSGAFTKGGWAQDWWNEVMEQVMREAMSVPYDLLLGRHTYEIFASHFPNANKDNPVAQKLNNAIKYVVASSKSPLEWENTIYLNKDFTSEIIELKKQDGPLLQVHGSWELIQELLKQNLVDELRLWTFPVIVGSGKRLLSEGTKFKKLSLIKSETCKNGAIMSIYKPIKTIDN